MTALIESFIFSMPFPSGSIRWWKSSWYTCRQDAFVFVVDFINSKIMDLSFAYIWDKNISRIRFRFQTFYNRKYYLWGIPIKTASLLPSGTVTYDACISLIWKREFIFPQSQSDHAPACLIKAADWSFHADSITGLFACRFRFHHQSRWWYLLCSSLIVVNLSLPRF